MQAFRRALVAAVLLLAATPLAAATEAPPLGVEAPGLVVRGVPFELALSGGNELPAAGLAVEVIGTDGKRLAAAVVLPGETVRVSVAGPADGMLRIAAPGAYRESIELQLRTIPGWWSILPPLLAIALALLLRHAMPALLAGVWLGASLRFGDPFIGLLRTIDHYVIQAIVDVDHVSILVFSMLLGGMVGIVSRSGGTHGLVEALTPYATDSRRGQIVTWTLGIFVFFDDYANTLLVGNTMRPVTDRLRISREKLAYIVDSTAAPVASVALVSTWIGYEVSLIGDALKSIGSTEEAYAVFLRSLPYNFYPFLALGFGLMIAAGVRDFGPMLRAERRALGGRLFGETARPLADFGGAALEPPADRPHRWWNAVVPVAVVLVTTFAGLWFTGRAALAVDGDPAGSAALADLGFRGLGTVFGAGNSFHALLWASAAGCIVALLLARAQGVLTLGEGFEAWTAGLKSMTPAYVILVLAWAIAAICSDLQTAGFMVEALSDRLDPRLLPAIVFMLAAATSFATGTSWGTMGILIPLAVPIAHGIAVAAGYDAVHDHAMVLGAISAVLAGAIFGDHCSPISDTTVLSSMASGCDHVDHVRTQLPYALVVGIVAVVTGYLPAGFGVHPVICLVVGMATLFGLLRLVGRPVAG